jgi:hypothetical protein
MGRKHGDPACWGHSPSQNAAFFKRLDEGKHCGQDWGFNLNAPAVLGYAETMQGYCEGRGRRLQGEGRRLQEGLIGACRGANLNILRIGGWNMCKNTEWIYCAAKGKLAPGGADSGGDLIFSLAPNSLELAPFYQKGGTGAYQGDGYYSENDIYYLEVCVLNEICANRDELFRLDRGGHFRCQYDSAGHAELRDGLLRWEHEDAPKRCGGWECMPYSGVAG